MTARYIDAVICADIISQKLNIPLDDLVDIFAEVPTADVVEVKHGEWIDKFEKVTTLGGNGIEREFLCGYKCSLCGRTEIKKEPYCNCGAKMDGIKEE